jgi:transcriptional regulator
VYRPPTFRRDDTEWCLEMISAHGFGLLISAGDGPDDVPLASPLPMRVRDGVLCGHVARANPHWRVFDGARVARAVFTGPHAYVSPTWMPDPGRSVPTWNYVQVHAVGRPRMLDDPARTIDVVRALSDQYEGAEGWRADAADVKFMAGMLRGIVAFEMPIEELKGKAKLSQNKPPAVVEAVARRLSERGEHDISKLMRAAG